VAIIDRVKWDGDPSLLAWKYPSEELSTATQLIVNESQEAFLVSGGVYEGPYGAGRHTLSTENIPILRNLFGLPFGGKSPFSAEVWFVNKVANLSVKWGTPDPIQLKDPQYQVMIPVRAFGQYGIRIVDAKSFLNNIVGNVELFDQNTLSNYFRGIFVSKIKTEISNLIIKSGVSVLDISTHLEDLSASLRQSLNPLIASYGVEIEQFSIASINVPEDDHAVQTLKGALAKKAEMGILGFNYQQEQSFNVLKAAAGNEGAAGGLVGAGVGLGVGFGMGGAVGQVASQMSLGNDPAAATKTPDSSVVTSAALSPAERISALKDLAELRSQGILSDSEFEAEKGKILNA